MDFLIRITLSEISCEVIYIEIEKKDDLNKTLQVNEVVEWILTNLGKQIIFKQT